MLLETNVCITRGAFRVSAAFELRSRRCGLFGPSGSGKTTLVNMLSGLLKPDNGYIRLDGVTLFDSDKRINLRPEERRVGVVFQHAHLFPHLNVRKNLLYGYSRTSTPHRKLDPDQVFEMLRLEPLLPRSVQQLSGGERQRVALGRTILASPRLVLLDEPLSGLDSELKYQIIPQLKRVFEEFSIPFLMISHSEQEMRLMTSEILAIENGILTGQAHTLLPAEPSSEPESCALPRRRNPTAKIGGAIPSYHLPEPGFLLARRPTL